MSAVHQQCVTRSHPNLSSQVWLGIKGLCVSVGGCVCMFLGLFTQNGFLLALVWSTCQVGGTASPQTGCQPLNQQTVLQKTQTCRNALMTLLWIYSGEKYNLYAQNSLQTALSNPADKQ